MLVGIDVDGVLADLVGGVSAYAAEHLPGKAFSVEQVTNWRFLDDRFGREEAYALIEKVWTQWQRYIKPLEPGHEVNNALAQLRRRGTMHKAVIITKESRPAHRHVLEFLASHAITYDGIVMLDYRTDKLEYPVDVLIDDNPACVAEARDYPRKTLFLYDQPWNRSLGGMEWPRNAVRVSSIGEAVAAILEGDRA